MISHGSCSWNGNGNIKPQCAWRPGHSSKNSICNAPETASLKFYYSPDILSSVILHSIEDCSQRLKTIQFKRGYYRPVLKRQRKDWSELFRYWGASRRYLDQTNLAWQSTCWSRGSKTNRIQSSVIYLFAENERYKLRDPTNLNASYWII